MKKIEAIVRPATLNTVVEALVRIGVAGMTLSQVLLTQCFGKGFNFSPKVAAVPPVIKVKIGKPPNPQRTTQRQRRKAAEVISDDWS